MNIFFWILLAAGLAVILSLKKLAVVEAAKAGHFIKQGAVVVDVRSPEEYRRRHLPGAINIPLSQLRAEAPRHLPDREQAVLLHCLSGGRSGMARRILKQMGYGNAHNLGSYGRAEKILLANGPDRSVV